MREILRVEGITAGYVPDLPIINDVALSAGQGRITLIVGPNGAGKSTLIKAVAGLVTVSKGRVALDGKDITGLRPDRMGRHAIAYVPQTDNIFRTLTIRQNLDLALARSGGTAEPLFDQFPVLADKQGDRAGTLSGGQRQFLALAMALAGAPRLILMDEPSAGLSPKATEDVMAQTRILADKGVSILLVEQNVKRALQIADHCYVLADGRNQIDGPAAALARGTVLEEIFLGGRRMGVA